MELLPPLVELGVLIVESDAVVVQDQVVEGAGPTEQSEQLRQAVSGIGPEVSGEGLETSPDICFPALPEVGDEILDGGEDPLSAHSGGGTCSGGGPAASPSGADGSLR